MFLESDGFVSVPVTMLNKFRLPDKSEHVYLIQLVTDIATKPQFSGNILPNIETCENG